MIEPATVFTWTAYLSASATCLALAGVVVAKAVRYVTKGK
jgi:hypothetical protein